MYFNICTPHSSPYLLTDSPILPTSPQLHVIFIFLITQSLVCVPNVVQGVDYSLSDTPVATPLKSTDWPSPRRLISPRLGDEVCERLCTQIKTYYPAVIVQAATAAVS